MPLPLVLSNKSLWPAVLVCKVRNRLELVRDKLPQKLLVKYKTRRRQQKIYEASAKLWAEGLQWSKALEIVQQAFDSVSYEWPMFLFQAASDSCSIKLQQVILRPWPVNPVGWNSKWNLSLLLACRTLLRVQVLFAKATFVTNSDALPKGNVVPCSDGWLQERAQLPAFLTFLMIPKYYVLASGMCSSSFVQWASGGQQK